MISQWLSTAQPGSPIPTELAARLGPEETREVEEIALGITPITSDWATLAQVIEGLESHNWVIRRQWAQRPLYRYKSRLSRDDYAKAVALQQELDNEGMTRPELAALKRPPPDTRDLDAAYKALEGNPDVYYFTDLPIGFDSRGRLHWPVLPEAGRTFLKGGLDLLKAARTGDELTPEAMLTFAGLTRGAGGVFGPPSDGTTFAASGARWLRMGGTPDKFSRTGREVVERMRGEGLILGEGPLLRGNPNRLRLVIDGGQSVPIDSNIDMAHRIAVVTWWNRTGRLYGARAAEVRQFMLDPDNYILQPRSINRSMGARLRETYQPPVPSTPTTPKR